MRAAHLLASLVLVPALLESRVAALDCNANGVDDALDLTRGPSNDCNVNGIPDECDLEPIHRGFFAGSPMTPFRDYSSPLFTPDLDLDGDADLAGSTWEQGGQLFLFWNDGAGSFESTAREPGTAEILRAAADFDGDGDVDLLVSRPLLGEVLALLNDGNGSFTGGPVAPVEEIFDVTAADLDGDGDEDLTGVARIGVLSRALAILTSIGHGAFATPEGLLTSGQPASPTTADLDNDGLQDIASIIDAGSVQVFINGGNEGWQKGPLIHPGATGPLISLHAVDLDLDGDVDLTVDSAQGPCVLSNDGTGSFVALSCYFIGYGATRSAVGDFDGDGAAEIAAVSYDGPRILLNAGKGSLGPVRRAGSSSRVFGSEALATADFDLDGALDIAGLPGPTVLWNRPMALSLDCNANGRPDECDALTGSLPGETQGSGTSCHDCNLNGIADSTDIELGLLDGNRDGVPDECEAPRVMLIAYAPDVVRGEPGERVLIPATVDLHSFGFQPGDRGTTSWALYLKSANASIEDASLEGTAAAPRPEGLRDPSTGYAQLRFIRDPGPCDGALRAIVALDVTQPVALDPADSPHAILRLTLGASVPRAGTGFCGLHFLSCDSCSRTIPIPGGGAGGCGGVDPSLAVSWDSALTTTTRDRIVLLKQSGFRRGDVNGSGKVDISDPIRLFMSLFLGADAPTCLDGADATDDGLVNITDGIFLLQDLFRGDPGSTIPSPGPFACGPDSTEDTLDCKDPGVCR